MHLFNIYKAFHTLFLSFHPFILSFYIVYLKVVLSYMLKSMKRHLMSRFFKSKFYINLSSPSVHAICQTHLSFLNCKHPNYYT